ncbi:MAG: ribose 5-phosphate isomerase A [Gammaproteobacteria bacterium]|nr:ribose 5-phosphate isomerase A [Gammaproteobacteria bacterium]
MDQNEKKLNVAKAAVKHIHNDCLLGMGTGSTVNFLIDLLPEIKNKISAVASSSVQTENLLKMNGFEVQALNQLGMLDLYIDGADEATKNLHLIKGGGGALTREKILAENSKKFICIADETKLVKRLGIFPLPIEVIPMARSFVSREIIKYHGKPVYRESFVTDNGNEIIDIHNLDIVDPIQLENDLNQIPGVVTVGIFARRKADVLLIAGEHGVDEIYP